MLALLLIAVGPKAAPRPGMRWTDAQMRAFIDTLKPVGVPLDALLAMCCAESGLDPHASSGSAWGIHQAQSPLLQAIGWKAAPQAFGKLSVEEQLPWVAKMLREQVRQIGYAPQNAAELWRMNLSPKAARARADILYRRDDPKEAAAYNGNKALDHGKKGWISMADLAESMASVTRGELFKFHLAQLRRLESDALPTV